MNFRNFHFSSQFSFLRLFPLILFSAEKITAEDIQRVAKRFLSSPPSLAARGDIKSLPELKEIQSGLMNLDGSFSKSKLNRLPNFSLFR